jgi:hypothetical protein
VSSLPARSIVKFAPARDGLEFFPAARAGYFRREAAGFRISTHAKDSSSLAISKSPVFNDSRFSNFAGRNYLFSRGISEKSVISLTSPEFAGESPAGKSGITWRHFLSNDISRVAPDGSSLGLAAESWVYQAPFFCAGKASISEGLSYFFIKVACVWKAVHRFLPSAGLVAGAEMAYVGKHFVGLYK